MDLCSVEMRRSCKVWEECSERYPGGGDNDLPPCASKIIETTDSASLAKEAAGYLKCDMEKHGGTFVKQYPGAAKLLQKIASALPQERAHNKLQALADGIERDMKSTNGFITDGAGVVKSLRQIVAEG